MSRFKPQVSFMTEESWRDYRNDYSNRIKSPCITKQYPTYAELKRNIEQHLIDHVSDEAVSVVRSKRGEWGEWFEKWELVNGKATIVKEGWN